MMEVPLKSVCTIMMGQAPPGTTYNQKSLGLPLIAGAGDFGELNPEPTKFTTEPTKIAKSGDLILCIRATIGDRNWADQQYCLGRGVAGLSPKPNQLDARYLWHWLEIGKNQLINQARGSTFKQVSQDVISSCQIPLPPLEEQRRIAAILDKADAVRRKRQQAIALTEELLRSVFLEMFGDPVTNLKGWKVSTLGKLLLGIESGWSPKCHSREASIDEWGVLKLGAVTWGYFNPCENKALLPNTVPRPELEVKSGDLLFSRKNTYELVGASAFVYTTRPKLLLPDLIFRLCLSNAVDPVYVWQALSQETMRIELSRLASGSSGSMPNISKARLSTLTLPVPSLKLQLKYHEFVDIFWKKHSHQKISLLFANNLFHSLLQRAFQGKL